MNWTKRSSEFFKSHLKPSSNGGWLLEIVVTKIVLDYCENNCSSDREKLLTFEAEGREFEKLCDHYRTICSNNETQNNFWYS